MPFMHYIPIEFRLFRCVIYLFSKLLDQNRLIKMHSNSGKSHAFLCLMTSYDQSHCFSQISARSFFCCPQHLKRIVRRDRSFEPCHRDGRLRWICCCEGAPNRASEGLQKASLNNISMHYMSILSVWNLANSHQNDL